MPERPGHHTGKRRRFPGTEESRVAHLRFADTLLELGDAEAAEREYSALLQTYPEHALDVRVLAGRGWAMLETAYSERFETVNKKNWE